MTNRSNSNTKSISQPLPWGKPERHETKDIMVWESFLIAASAG